MFCKNDNKFIAAEPEKYIAAAQVFFYSLAYSDNKLIAFTVSIIVIDLFEWVYIKHTGYKTMAILMSCFNQFFQKLFACTSGQCIGQFIKTGIMESFFWICYIYRLLQMYDWAVKPINKAVMVFVNTSGFRIDFFPVNSLIRRRITQ